MAVALFQQKIQAAASSTAGGETFTLGSTPVTGNFAVFCTLNNDDATGPSIAGGGITWTKQDYFRGDVSHDNIAIFTGPVGGSPSTLCSITWHAGTGAGPYAAQYAEFSGTSNTIDGTPPTPTNLSSTTPALTSNAPSRSGQLAVAFMGIHTVTSPTGNPSGFTMLTANTANRWLNGGYQVLGSSSAVTATWTWAASQAALGEILIINVPSTATHNMSATGAGT